MEITYQEEGYQEVLVQNLDELNAVIKQHGGADDTFNGLPQGADTPNTTIGEQLCKDGVRVRFKASDAKTASRIYNRMF